MKRFICGAILFFAALAAYAGGYDIRYITNADGLSNSSVNAVFQDSKGRMWFGTWDGLNCWNGTNFKVYKPVQGDSASISSNIIRDILEDGEGGIWIATDRGIDCLDPETGRARRYFTREGERSNVERGFGIAFYEGEVYAYSYGSGFFRFEDGRFRLIKASSEYFVRFKMGEDGPVALSKDGRVSKVGADDGDAFPSYPGVNALLFRQGETFFAEQGGLRVGDEWIIRDIPVLSLCGGTQDIIWAGTDMHGVAMITPESKLFEFVGGMFEGSAVRCFCEDERGNLYVGTKGAGTVMFSPAGKVLNRFTTADGLLNNSVYAMTETADRLWLGTDGAGLNYVDKHTGRLHVLDMPEDLGVSSVYSIYCPHGDSLLWVGTSGGGLFKLTVNGQKVEQWERYGSEFLGSDVVYSVLGNGRDRIWIGTRGGGLHRYMPEKGEFTPLPAGYDVTCLALGKDESLLAGTSMGLYRFHPDGSVEHYGEREGLPNNTIHGITLDDEGNIWVSTNNGLSKIMPTGIVSWFMRDGLQNNEFSDGAAYKSHKTGLMYFGGIGGFNRFDAEAVKGSGYFPELVLDAFFVDNVPIPLPDKLRGGMLTLPHDKSSFSFRFVPVDYLNGDRCELEYMLEGFDKVPVRMGHSGTIVFSNLKPGRYTLKVRCSNADREWSGDGYVLPVRITPLWYESPLAFIVYALILLLAFWLLNRMRQERQRVKMRIAQERMEKEKMEEVHEAKLQFFTNIAHEFSNSLTLIYGPCAELQSKGRLSPEQKHYLNVIESNSDRMQSLIQQLILFRKAETGHLSVSYEPLDIPELVRFEADYFLDRLEQGRIEFTVDADPAEIIWNTDKDSMEKIVFNLLSNALKYTPAGEKIKVSLRCVGPDLKMDFTNTGVGISEDKRTTIFDRFVVLDRFEKALSKGRVSNGIGLAMCKSLVEVLGGTISLDSDGTSFTSFKVVLPPREATAPSSGMPSGMPSEDGGEASALEAEVPVVKMSDVLIVDDEKDIRSFIAGVLYDRFNILEASGGEEALDILSRREPALVISDVMMPGMNGVELLRRIKGDDRLRHIPFILLSGKNAVEDQIEGLENGADAYMGKPFHPRHLLAVIDSLLGREAVLREYSQSAYSAVEQLEGNIVKKSDKELLTTITDIILRNLDSDSLSVDQIADEAAISKMQLYRKLKELTGMTPTEYIRHLRLQHAERLLTTTSRTVQEIMFECGFSSKTYFYREFSKRFGMTPKEYRSSIND